MQEFIKSIWLGEEYPIERCAVNNKQIRNLEALRERNRLKLVQALNEAERRTFENYIDCVDELVSLYLEEAFVSGVRYSAHFMLEALQ